MINTKEIIYKTHKTTRLIKISRKNFRNICYYDLLYVYLQCQKLNINISTINISSNKQY